MFTSLNHAVKLPEFRLDCGLDTSTPRFFKFPRLTLGQQGAFLVAKVAQQFLFSQAVEEYPIYFLSVGRIVLLDVITTRFSGEPVS